MGKPDRMTFERAIARLEEIVGALDGGELSLDESVALFEEGVKLAKQCSKQLTKAQGRLETLVKKPDGSSDSEPLDV